MSDLYRPAEPFTALQQAATQLTQQIEQQKALANLLERLRTALDLERLFQVTATEVRQLLQADRVGVFRFTPGSGWDEGTFVSEAVAPGVQSALAANVFDHCFGSQFAAHYAQGRVQAVADIHDAGLSACHVQVLAQFQVRANLVVPLRQQDELWGLLCIHQCCQPRQWQHAEIEFVGSVAAHFAIALQQAAYLQQLQTQAAVLKQTLQSLHQSQAQLIQNEKMVSLGQLVAGVAHEIKNPINVIYGNLEHVQGYVQGVLDVVQLYQQHYPEATPDIQATAAKVDLEFIQTDLPHLLRAMQVNTERIRQLVLSLHNFSRLDEAAYKQADLHTGLDSTLLILSHRLRHSDSQDVSQSEAHDDDQTAITVLKEYGDLPLVECYPAQLNQVFLQLLTNAIEAIAAAHSQSTESARSTKPGQITIQTVSLSAEWVQVTIRDNGIGMPEAVCQRVFEPFFTTKDSRQGSGMGLFLSYQLVTENHGGILVCTSVPDEGTVFTLQIPVQHPL